jgi:hypothetical protein
MEMSIDLQEARTLRTTKFRGVIDGWTRDLVLEFRERTSPLRAILRDDRGLARASKPNLA